MEDAEDYRLDDEQQEQGLGPAFSGTVKVTQIVPIAEEEESPPLSLEAERSSNPDCEYPACLCTREQSERYCDITQ